MTGQYRLTRHVYDERIWEGVDRGSTSATLGGQLEWFWSVPGVFRALASPSTNEPVPAAPGAIDPHIHSCGYWTALHYLLLYRLGWAKPDKGLRGWYAAGKPVDDPTLALVSEVWDLDRNLDAYLVWVLRRQALFLTAAHHIATWRQNPEALTPEWDRWLETADAAVHLTATHNLVGGSDPLHLTHHSGNTGRDSTAKLVVLDKPTRRAVFLSDDMNGWYFGLEEVARRELGAGYGGWRIEVFVRPVGFLGVYRRSRETGLWFVGRHRNHSPGN